MTQPSLVTQAVQAAFWKDVKHIENVDEFNLATALRAVVQELKCFGITEKNILTIADELEAL
jgi:DNA-binding transcriptional regulator YhcF (GntR family)